MHDLFCALEWDISEADGDWICSEETSVSPEGNDVHLDDDTKVTGTIAST